MVNAVHQLIWFHVSLYSSFSEWPFRWTCHPRGGNLHIRFETEDDISVFLFFFSFFFCKLFCRDYFKKIWLAWIACADVCVCILHVSCMCVCVCMQACVSVYVRAFWLCFMLECWYIIMIFDCYVCLLYIFIWLYVMLMYELGTWCLR